MKIQILPQKKNILIDGFQGYTNNYIMLKVEKYLQNIKNILEEKSVLARFPRSVYNFTILQQC